MGGVTDSVHVGAKDQAAGAIEAEAKHLSHLTGARDFDPRAHRRFPSSQISVKFPSTVVS
jgi:hypothetical protein